ncbi:nitrite reductase (NO-forming) [Fibrisoma limi BUZ 3]|uniref:Nitrite reductase (NO-forming) n=2 Tax=Fibrisoma limi TaxID=663275 RepID=I2GIP0_9BACT|nr:nitrite reductase (NO-forming) [Fibrisoma limi BUZ 3]
MTRSFLKRKDAKVTQSSPGHSGVISRYVGGLGLFALLLMVMSCQSEEEIKRQRYITEGLLLYKTYCANCHQADGKGLEALYPPLAGSDYLVNKNSVICLIRYGQQGPIVVNGKTYNRPMPAQLQLSDLEVAELMTYIYNEWGGETKVTDVKTVSPILADCKKQR